jgi:hypothetical protein
MKWFHLIRICTSGHPDETGRITLIEEAKIDCLVADELGGRRDDRIEDVLQWCALRQRSLNAGKLDEQRVAVVHHLRERLMFVRVAFAVRMLGFPHQAVEPVPGGCHRPRDDVPE